MKMSAHSSCRADAVLEAGASQSARSPRTNPVWRWNALRCWVSVLVLAVLLAAVSGSAEAAPGDLDPSFGTGGEVTTSFPEDAAAQAVAIQLDGKLVVAGWTRVGGTPTFALARYKPDGVLDSSFGSGGKVLTDFGGFSVANAVALQPDGKIVAAGFNASSTGGFALARYNTDGALDPFFGNGGTVTTFFPFPSSGVDAFSVLIQPDSKIVAAGGSEGGGNVVSRTFEVVRYNTDGSLDQSFGTGGIANTDFGGFAEVGDAAALQPDGKIIEVGYTLDGCCTQQDFALVRFNSDGTLDSTFGSGGKVTTDFDGQGDRAWAVTVQPDNKIVVAGAAGPPTGSGGFGVARYNPDGTLDPNFGTGGKVIADFGLNFDAARAVALTPSGKIIAAGSVTTPSFSGDFGLARFNADGSPDGTFGTGGEVTTDFAGDSDAAFGLALQSDGRIVGVGVTVPPNGPAKFALARYLGGSNDLTAPTLTVPGPITVNATSPNGSVVTYTVTATDPDDAVASLACVSASGSTFPVGTTTVNCTASDTHGNASAASFTVHVKGAAEQLGDLLAAVTGVGPGSSLADKVALLQSYLAADDVADACSTLTAFINQVNAQQGKTIPGGQAATLIASAQRIGAVLGC